jgi:hypothetical protein
MTLSLLGPLPPDLGECRSAPMSGAPFAGWREVRLVLGDGTAVMRVVTAIYDPDGRPGGVSDLVATDLGRRQASFQARVEPDGRMQGTYWLVEDDRHTPRAMTDAELSGLRRVADALRQRCAPDGTA